jgi:hypothetical protein
MKILHLLGLTNVFEPTLLGAQMSTPRITLLCDTIGFDFDGQLATRRSSRAGAAG